MLTKYKKEKTWKVASERVVEDFLYNYVTDIEREK